MKYVLNEGRYSLAFVIKEGALERKVTFDKKRIYLDTGNIATSGITEVDDKTYKALLENKRFSKLLESKELSLVDPKKLLNSDSVNEVLKKENEELKAKLEQAQKQTGKAEIEKALKSKDDEIKDLKAQLEALSGTKQNTETKDETNTEANAETKDVTEGF